MAKATMTIKEALNYQPRHAQYFAANQSLFNRVVAFYFDCIQAHGGILALANKEALTVLERLTHATAENPAPIMPLTEVAPDIPAMFELGSPQLIRHGNKWWLHTSIEKTFTAPPKIVEQVTKPQTKICAVDLNLDQHLAVCSVQTVEGTIIATRFIGGGRAISGFRKKLLGRIARNRSQTGIIAENEQDNADLWRKIRHRDDDLAHLVSARIVQFAKEHGASILVFEHLGNLKPENGKYSRRGNTKRAYWIKGRIFKYAKYKAWQHQIITSRVNPTNTSRECHRCHSLVDRYNAAQPGEGYTPGASLVLCETSQSRDHSDRNASLVIGQRLLERYAEPLKEKPHTAVRRVGRVSKETGVARSQDAKRKKGPSISDRKSTRLNSSPT